MSTDQICSEFCISSFANNVCDVICLTAGCNYDGGDCCNTFVCPLALIGNGQCDDNCAQFVDCAFDAGKIFASRVYC